MDGYKKRAGLDASHVVVFIRPMDFRKKIAQALALAIGSLSPVDLLPRLHHIGTRTGAISKFVGWIFWV